MIIDDIRRDLKKQSAIDNPESLMREIAIFSSYLPHLAEYTAEAEAIYRRKRQEVACLEDVESLTSEKFKIAVDSGSSPECRNRNELEMLYRITLSRLDVLRTIISVRKTELEKLQ